MLINRLTLIFRWLLEVSALTAGYYLLAQLCFLLAVYPENVAPIWLPSGLALAWGWLRGFPALAGVFFGSYLANTTSCDFWTAVTIAVGSTGQTLLALWLMKRFAQPKEGRLPQRATELVSYLLIATLSPVLAATVGVISLYLGGYLVSPLAVQSWLAWWLGDASGYLLLTPSILVAAAYWLKQRNADLHMFLLSTLLVGMGIMAEVIVVRQHRQFVEQDYRERANQVAGKIREAGNMIQLTVSSIASFFSASESISRQEFNVFCRALLQGNNWIQALEWVPRISKADKEKWEDLAIADGYLNFKIYEKINSDRVPVALRDFYFPVFYVEPYPGNEVALGFDLASQTTRLDALRQAWKTAKPVATAPIRLVQERGIQAGFLLFVPVYKEGITNQVNLPLTDEMLRGFALGVIRMEDVVRGVLENQDRNGLDILLTDKSAPLAERKLAWLPGVSSENTSPIPTTLTGELVWEQTLFVAGREWLVQVQPTYDQLVAIATAVSPFRGIPFVLSLFLASLVIFYAHLRQTTEAALLREQYSLADRVRERTIELEDQRQQLLTLVHTIPDLVWLKNLQGVYLACNPAFERFLGSTESEIVGHTDYDFIDTELADFFRTRDQAAAKASNPLVNEEWVTFADDGRLALVETVKTPLADGTGNVIGVLGIARDITAAYRGREALQQSEARYRALFEESPLGYSLTRLEENGFLQINAAFAKIVNYPLAELLSLTDEIFIPDNYREQENHQLHVLRETGRCGPYEIEYLCKGGRQIPVRVTRVLIAEGDGPPLVLSVVEDITNRRQIERAMEQAKEAAEFANRMKSTFLANMSHELRTPMNGVLGMAQLLLQKNLGEPERIEYANTILNSGQMLLELLNDILDLSKVEAGKMELERIIFSPAQLAKDLERLYSGLAAHKHITMIFSLPGLEQRQFKGDPHRLQQMLSNLIGNALKFTEQGSIRIEVTLVDQNPEKTTLEFSVTDTGLGIPKEKIALLFKPFSQVDSSTTREFGGSGLGLSIVRSLARLMEGEVGLESEMGKGSRFWFRIKVETIAISEKASASSNSIDKKKTPIPKVNYQGKILVVEDNPTNRKVIQIMLEKFGLTVSFAENGQQGVNCIQNGIFDLVLMDVQMPIMDGYEATQTIRRWEEENNRQRLPIVALTADAFEGDRRKSLDAGMDSFLAKPINVADLAEVLSYWLKPLYS